mmetsp:Transcript_23382/g.17810  ORF Transcript_23382/g.17810 Transcript_23382/m.17810 type:complete len:83 (+) Transcript_23382:357-605(+)
MNFALQQRLMSSIPGRVTELEEKVEKLDDFNRRIEELEKRIQEVGNVGPPVEIKGDFDMSQLTSLLGGYLKKSDLDSLEKRL